MTSPSAAVETPAMPRNNSRRIVPWFLWVAVLAVFSAVIGVQWDIAWHRSVGRDTFWSPPHMAIYLGGVLAGLASGYLILGTTFFAPSQRATAVRIWGLHGPFGAFVSAWGGVAMLASAPFDDWWHNSYGLDVKILSPPHAVLGLGLVAIQFGGLFLIAGARNRESGPRRTLLTTLFFAVGGLLLVGLLTFQMEFIGRVLQHTPTFYLVVGGLVPLILLGVGQASGHRFGSSITAAVYSAVMLLLLWILPLIPATPKLGPVYFQVNHLVPAGFPLLLLAPALAVDLLRSRLAAHSLTRQSIALGLLFLAVFLCAQWPLANFLMTPAARNWLFGSHYLSYNSSRAWATLRYQFVPQDPSLPAFLAKMACAFLASVLSSRLGLGWANFLHRLQR